MQTPWGKADSQRVFADGIVFYSTPSHGGFKLSALRLAEIPPNLRLSKGRKQYTSDSWFEEDVEANIVSYVWPEFFTEVFRTDDLESIRAQSLASLKRYNYA